MNQWRFLLGLHGAELSRMSSLVRPPEMENPGKAFLFPISKRDPRCFFVCVSHNRNWNKKKSSTEQGMWFAIPRILASSTCGFLARAIHCRRPCPWCAGRIATRRASGVQIPTFVFWNCRCRGLGGGLQIERRNYAAQERARPGDFQFQSSSVFVWCDVRQMQFHEGPAGRKELCANTTTQSVTHMFEWAGGQWFPGLAHRLRLREQCDSKDLVSSVWLEGRE